MNARTIRFAVLVSALSIACFSPLAIAQTKPPDAPSSPGLEAAGTTDWREQYAYTLGMQAYIFGIPPRMFGRAGLSDDFLLRASAQCMGGIISNDPEEAVYYNTTKDGAGQTFDSGKNYVLHFAPGELPKVNGFWSLSMYDPTFNFTDNPLNRYSLGDRTKGLKRDADGGLTLYIQRMSPGNDKESNWLPSTESGAFLLVLRTYMPGTEIVEQRWAPPPVTETGRGGK